MPDSELHNTVTPSRRAFMRASVAAAAAGATGSASVWSSHSPFGRSEALLPALGVLAVGAAAGLYVGVNWQINSRTSDFSDVDNQQASLEIWSTTDSVDTASQSGWRDIFNAWRLTADSDPIHDGNPVYSTSFTGTTGESAYLNAAWSEIRAELTSSIENGVDAATAKTNCRNVLDIHTTRAAINLLEAHNEQLASVSEELVENAERGLALFYNLGPQGATPTPSIQARAVTTDFVTNGSASVQTEAGEVVLGSTPVDHFPASLADVPGVDDNATYELLWFSTYRDSDGTMGPASGLVVDGSTNSVDAESGGTPEPFAVKGSGPVIDTNPHRTSNLGIRDAAVEDFGPVWAMPNVFAKASALLSQQYNQVRTEINTYVDSAYAAYQAGDLDPSELLTSADIVDQFSDGDTTTRLTAELAASGFLTPENIKDQTQITVRHSDITNGDGAMNDERTGLLYLQTGADITVSEGSSIAAADYSSAYIAYHQTDGNGNTEFTTDVLSGDSPLEIVEIHGDQSQINYTQWVENISDPTDTTQLQSQIDAITALRDEIEQLREARASNGGGGSSGDSGFLSGEWMGVPKAGWLLGGTGVSLLGYGLYSDDDDDYSSRRGGGRY